MPACIVTTNDGLAFADGIDRGRIVVSGADTDGRYSLMEWTVGVPAASEGEPIGYGPHRHHACEETFLIRRGSLDFLLGDEVRTLHAGDFVRVPAGTRHGYANTSGSEVEMLVSFMPAGLEMLFVRYRTDAIETVEGDGFVADATRFHATEFDG